MILAVMNAISFHISFPTMEVAGYFKLMLLGTYTIIVFECSTHSSLKWPPLMIQINLLALDTDCVQSRNYGKWVKCPT